MNELWYSTGSNAGRLSEDSPTRQALNLNTPPTESQMIARTMRAIVSEFGAINGAMVDVATSFEDAKAAIDALVDAHGESILSEPEHCAFCPKEGERAQHYFDTTYLAGVPIWTRICKRHEGEPLCPKTPDGFHDDFVAATDEGFLIENTTVVDVERLDEVGHCRRCGAPLVKDGESWRYWTAQERGRLLT